MQVELTKKRDGPSRYTHLGQLWTKIPTPSGSGRVIIARENLYFDSPGWNVTYSFLSEHTDALLAHQGV
jgi:hypothetical protein